MVEDLKLDIQRRLKDQILYRVTSYVYKEVKGNRKSAASSLSWSSADSATTLLRKNKQK